MSINLFLVEADEAFGNMMIPNGAEAAAIWDRCGERSTEPWIPPTGQPPEDIDFVPTDCICSYSSLTLLLNRKARDALGHLLAPCGEFLPVILGSYDYCWFNCLTEHDAADWDRCEGERRKNARPHHPPFREVRRYEFFPNRVADAPAIFQLDRGGLQLFCTDTLKDAIEQADLTGFALEHLWSSDTGGIRRPRIGMEGLGGEAGRLRQARNEQARRDMLDRMRDEASAPAISCSGAE